MKRDLFFKLFILVSLSLSTSALGQTELAQSIIGCGGERMGGPNHVVTSTVGQTAIGVVMGPAHLHQIGFWYQPNYLLTAVEELSPLAPRERWLGQNHPNPFNPMTNIEFAVPERIHVTLNVYDLTGRLVQALVTGEIAPGYHQATFDGHGLASGIYVCRMVAGDFVQTKKLMLIK